MNLFPYSPPAVDLTKKERGIKAFEKKEKPLPPPPPPKVGIYTLQSYFPLLFC